MDLVICCNIETKPYTKYSYCNANNTQYVETSCDECGKKYLNWYQDNSAGNSGGSELIKEEN